MNSNTVSKVAMGIVGIALVTALVLPGRQTAQVLAAGGRRQRIQQRPRHRD